MRAPWAGIDTQTNSCTPLLASEQRGLTKATPVRGGSEMGGLRRLRRGDRGGLGQRGIERGYGGEQRLGTRWPSERTAREPAEAGPSPEARYHKLLQTLRRMAQDNQTAVRHLKPRHPVHTMRSLQTGAHTLGTELCTCVHIRIRVRLCVYTCVYAESTYASTYICVPYS